MVSQVNAKIYPFGEATIPNLWILLCAFHAYFTALTGIPVCPSHLLNLILSRLTPQIARGDRRPDLA
jgi:hypothetical protein